MSLPIVLPPPAASNLIDANATYTYVVAQTGATSFTVDPLADFDLSITAGGVLSLKYTGFSAVGFSQSFNVVIHVTNASGSVTSTVTFVVNVGSFPRSFPNITSAALTNGGIAAPVSYRITSDIPAGTYTALSYSASGLPAGLSCDSTTGVISGTPPATNATYAVVLGATVIATLYGWRFNYFRYWILTVGIGGALSAIDTPNDGGAGGITGGTTGSGNILYDGDYRSAQLAGQPIFEAPFLPDDPKIYLYRVPFWQFRVNYTEPALDSAGLFGGLYVGTVKGSFKDIGGGIIEFWREYATVPLLRNEFESYVYSYQIVGTVNGALVNNIGEIPLTVMSRVQYDYFQTTTPQTSIALPRAPRVASVPFGNDSGLQILNGWDLIPIGAEMLAEDACARRWKGNIYERSQRFVVKTVA